jgi:serine phosphatase RsbU (regulator of sigma subunit)
VPTVLSWVGYWLVVALVPMLLYLAITLFRVGRRLQTWHAVALALLCLFVPPVLLGLLVYLAVGAIRGRRTYPNWGRLAVALLLAACAGSALLSGANALTRPGRNPIFWALGPTLFLLLFYLFPGPSDARFAWRGTRQLAILFGLTQIGHLFASNTSPSTSRAPNVSQMTPALLAVIHLAQMLADMAAVALIIIGIAAQMRARYRYLGVAGACPPVRRSALAGALAVGLLMLVAAALLFAPPFAVWSLPPLLGTALFLVLALAPVPIGFMTLHAQPYDRAALSNRALVYGALIACLIAIYAVGVAAVSVVLANGPATPQIGIIAAALALAAVFRPLRAWLQNRVDQRLFPRKYAADRILGGLSARLSTAIHLDQLSDWLIAAVREALRPESVTLWLRTAPSLSLQAVERMLPRANAGPERAWELQARRTDAGGAQTLVIAADDPIRAALPQAGGAVDVAQLPADSTAVRALKAEGAALALPLASDGELVGMLALGPEAPGIRYSFDLRELLETLAAQMAPALRVALVMHEQDVEGRERVRVEQELRTARRIQQTLLPKAIPTLGGWQIATYYEPAREVGGDFYDFIPFGDGRLGLVIGDVTDKGVPAALVMATTRSMLRAAAQGEAAPGAVLARVNNLLCADLPPTMFVTCFYAILDPGSGRLRFANAGQNLPYLRHADGEVCELRATGMPLGLMEGMDYAEQEVELVVGDSVLFYSDGLVEAHNGKREMFGLPRLMALYARGPGDAGIIEVLLDALRTFTGAGWEQEDDVTLMTLRRAL